MIIFSSCARKLIDGICFFLESLHKFNINDRKTDDHLKRSNKISTRSIGASKSITHRSHSSEKHHVSLPMKSNRYRSSSINKSKEQRLSFHTMSSRYEKSKETVAYDNLKNKTALQKGIFVFLVNSSSFNSTEII